MKRYITWFFAVLALVLIALIFRPVPIVKESECLVATGIVEKIAENGVKDVGIQLVGEDRSFYINRGLERGLELASLQEQLIGQEVTLKYPRYWTPLDPADKHKHVSVLEFKSKRLFDETTK